MNKECYIVSDLMSLYNEQLLSKETIAWLEKHVKQCEQCEQLLNNTKKDLNITEINSPIVSNEMFHKINRKLSVYKFIFVVVSFILAMVTSLLNDSFQFILTYTILGALVYCFYKRITIVFLITFVPVFIWYIGLTAHEYYAGFYESSVTNGEVIGYALYGGIITSLIHLIFAMVGVVIGYIILKIIGSGNDDKA